MKACYYKIATFFSRAQQEALFQDIERSVHESIFLKEGTRQTLQRFQTISQKINFCVSNYYFEKDLLDGLLSLDAFISKYKASQRPQILQKKSLKR